MSTITVEDIMNMTDEEVRALNKKLGKKALSRFLLFMGIKWALIFGATYVSRKLLDEKK